MTMPLCFVDTETTGLHVDKQLWEVAIIRRDWEKETNPEPGHYHYEPGWTETRYEAFVPVDLSNADLFGLNVGRFYERHPFGQYLSGRVELVGDLEDHLPLDIQVAEQIARFTHGARFIGGAPSFDAEVLGKFLRKHGLLPTWHHRLIDTHYLLTGYLIGMFPNLKAADVLTMSKDDKVRMIGIEPHTGDSLHTAMGDAQHEADIWDAIMG